MNANYAVGSGLLLLTIVGWVAMRTYLRQPILHAWLGAACAAFISSAAALLAVDPDFAPIAHIVANAAGLMTGYCFMRGVRFEATAKESGAFETIASVAASLAIALVLALAVPNLRLRIVLVGCGVGTAFLAALYWTPALLERVRPRALGVAIAVLVTGIGIILSLPLVEYLLTHGGRAEAYPHYKGTFAVMVVGAAIFAAVSLSQHRPPRPRKSPYPATDMRP